MSSEAASHREQRKHQPYDKNQRGEKKEKNDHQQCFEKDVMDVDDAEDEQNFLDIEKGEWPVVSTLVHC